MVVHLSTLREALQVSTLTLQVADLNSQLQQSVPGANVKGRVAYAGRNNPGTFDEKFFVFFFSLSLCRTSKDSKSENR